eukprot:545217_1
MILKILMYQLSTEDIIISKNMIQMGTFTLNRNIESGLMKELCDISYCSEASTVKRNLMKLLRELSLAKAILLEGSPGVGKTSLIITSGKLCGAKVVRINLSEQTDMMDLLGSDYHNQLNKDLIGQMVYFYKQYKTVIGYY